MNKATSHPSSSESSTAASKEQKAKRSRPRRRRESTLGKSTNAEANRRAAVILTVLAGERLPSEAATLLGVSITHYYILERKALEGLVTACQRKPKGPPGPTAEQQVARLERELQQCQRECQRQAALVRSTQRALGLPAVTPAAKSKENGSPGRKNGKKTSAKRRRRRPTVRALRAAEALEKNSSLSNSAGELKQSSPDASPDASTGSFGTSQKER